MALHLVLVAYFVGPVLAALTEPVVDYGLGAHHLASALDGIRSDGVAWVYDPTAQAGQPAGLIERSSARGGSILALGLTPLGLGAFTAQNLVTLAVHSVVPFVGYASARLFGLERRSALVTALLWVLLWYFDSLSHWLWFTGRISWSLGAMMSVLGAALFFSALERRRASLVAAAALAVSLAAVVLPLALLVVALPALLLYRRGRREVGSGVAVSAGVAGAVAIAAAATALFPVFDTPRFDSGVGPVLAPTADFFFTDLVDLLRDSEMTGAPVRTMLRMLCLVACGIQLWRWHANSKARAETLLALVAVPLFAAYAGGHVPGLRYAEPYALVLPATLAAAIGAGALLSRVVTVAHWQETTRTGRVLLGLAALVVLPRFAQTVAQYVPEVLPTPLRVAGDERPFASPLVGLNEPRPDQQTYRAPKESWVELADWLDASPLPGRALIQSWDVAQHVVATTDVAVIGGVIESRLPGAEANLFSRPDHGALHGYALQVYLETYAVGVVVVSGASLALEHQPALLRFRAEVGEFRIFETLVDPTYFMRGKGRIQSQRNNVIEVADASGEPLVLRFHWYPTLECDPGCTLEPEGVDGQLTPFIRVRGAPTAFVIRNGYGR